MSGVTTGSARPTPSVVVATRKGIEHFRLNGLDQANADIRVEAVLANSALFFASFFPVSRLNPDVLGETIWPGFVGSRQGLVESGNE